jgi:hypothetical protein
LLIGGFLPGVDVPAWPTIAAIQVRCPRRKVVIPPGLGDPAYLEKLEAEGLDLGDDAEDRGLIFKKPVEYGVAGGQLVYRAGDAAITRACGPSR